jgi:hypothetical protein
VQTVFFYPQHFTFNLEVRDKTGWSSLLVEKITERRKRERFPFYIFTWSTQRCKFIVLLYSLLIEKS